MERSLIKEQGENMVVRIFLFYLSLEMNTVQEPEFLSCKVKDLVFNGAG